MADDGDGLPSCLGLFAVLLATVGLFASMGGNFWCDFATRSVAFSPVGSDVTNTTEVSWGLWNYEAYETWTSTNGDQVYVTTYRYCIPFDGSIPMDAKWQSAKAFSIISAIVGGIFALASCAIVCVRPSKGGMMIIALGFLMTALFQGLVFLYFASNGCKGAPSQVTMGGTTYDTTWADCTRSNAANVAITGAVFWFASAVVLLIAAVRFTGGGEEEFGEKSARTEGEETTGAAATNE